VNTEQQMRALLDLVEADRAQQCGQILGDAKARADVLLAQAHADARSRMRQAFDDQRQRRREKIVAAQARLATQRRLHEQQRTAALLRLAWDQLPGELLTLWQQPASRAAWVAHVLASARTRMPRGSWHLVHAPTWPAEEQHALAQMLVAESGAAPVFDADTTITAGLKVLANGNAIDGTLAGLLAGRAEIEARLLRLLEQSP
jgi:vacuolar-type H+-ATPase subunit H